MWRSKENLTKGLHSICIAYVPLIVCNTDGWLSGRMDRRWLMDGCMYEGRTAGCPPLHLHYCRVLNLFHSMRKKQKQIWTSSPLLCSELNPSPPLGSQTDVTTALLFLPPPLSLPDIRWGWENSPINYMFNSLTLFPGRPLEHHTALRGVVFRRMPNYLKPCQRGGWVPAALGGVGLGETSSPVTWRC